MSLLVLNGTKIQAYTPPPPPSGSGFNLLRDFNTGIPGTEAERAADAFDDRAGDSLYTTAEAFEGGQGCSLTVTGGTYGSGVFGGVINFPEQVRSGDTLWIDLMIKVPAGFVIETPGNGSLKYLRVRMQTAANGQNGYFDLQLQDDDKTVSEFRMLREGQNVWQNFGADGVLTRDTWHRHTLCMKMDKTLQANGGTSRIRFWQNTTLLVDSATTRTFLDTTDYCDSLWLFTYWNGTAPQTQTLYVDRIRISTDVVPAWASGLEGVA